ncbi:hypothetical protein HFX_6459 (plasmid) [Haloferax mediterranei ATCC 33500]|uniref:Uncharacterized protein n=1 Tax=Haloferax mediterranei (strain ATCC 33500 / DSM 1411 / JCM 8866 / NBRC 14739 / NCIMB 2177 / R-4) TaxID=523841 RepID=I3RBG6_HALMT|nr:hypothetical protein HFX_6459 [Haloferax mediterranei ATCC 33500]
MSWNCCSKSVSDFGTQWYLSTLSLREDSGPEERAEDDAVDDVDRPEHRHHVAVGFRPDDHPHPEYHSPDHEEDSVSEAESDGNDGGAESEAESDGNDGGAESEADQRNTDSKDGTSDDAVGYV